MITPQADLEGTDRQVELVPPAAVAAPTPPAAETRTPATRNPAPATEQQGAEMAWASMILLGTLVLLVGIGLWIAVASNISIAAALLGGALLVLVIAAIANVLDDAMLRPQP